MKLSARDLSLILICPSTFISHIYTRAILVIIFPFLSLPLPSLYRYTFISIHINNWNNVRSNKYLLRAITNVNFRRYSAFRCRFCRKSILGSIARLSCFRRKKKKRRGRREKEGSGDGRRGKSTNLTKHPFPRRQRVVLPLRRFLPFIYSFFIIILFFYFGRKTKRPLCTIKSLMSEDVAGGGRGRRARGRKPVMERGKSARGS